VLTARELDTVIKLTKNQPHDRDAIVRVEGRLDSETVHELETLLAGINSRDRVVLDLSGLASIDHDGRRMLVRLRAAGHRIVGASLYIHQLLEEAQP
jgi:anti-anti-sigma regulatory factor